MSGVGHLPPSGAPGARRGRRTMCSLSSTRFPFGRPVSARLVGSNLASSRIRLARQAAKACRKSSDPLRRPVHQNRMTGKFSCCSSACVHATSGTLTSIEGGRRVICYRFDCSDHRVAPTPLVPPCMFRNMVVGRTQQAKSAETREVLLALNDFHKSTLRSSGQEVVADVL